MVQVNLVERTEYFYGLKYELNKYRKQEETDMIISLTVNLDVLTILNFMSYTFIRCHATFTFLNR